MKTKKISFLCWLLVLILTISPIAPAFAYTGDLPGTSHELSEGDTPQPPDEGEPADTDENAQNAGTEEPQGSVPGDAGDKAPNGADKEPVDGSEEYAGSDADIDPDDAFHAGAEKRRQNCRIWGFLICLRIL